jgi:integrase
MGKRWRKYQVGRYRLGTLRNPKLGKDEAVVCWRDEAGKHRHRLGVYSETEGRIAVDRFVGRFQALKARDSQTVDDLWDAYVADREKDGKLIATFRYNWQALKPRFGAMQIADINHDVCRSYTKARIDQGRSAGTVWTELTRLRSALNWACKQHLIQKVPPIWIPSKPKSKQRTLSQEEIWRLYDGALERHVKIFIALALGTGGRTEAILGLTWDRVDFDGSAIDLQEKAVVNPLTKKVRKGRANVPMSDELRAILHDAKQYAITDHVVEWGAQSIRKIRKGFTAAVERAGLGEYFHSPTATNWHNVAWWSDVTPHTLRHTVASAATEANIPMLKVSRFLGHRDQATTERIYTKTKPEFTTEVANVVKIRRRVVG